ncbi:MarR family winged helix-turn-helix transcriptional regulator [Naumannella halotolerans]|uniref:DNA-binding MarR family transcriptional regulator n=1 Tax=Naumannella halotolerans TaxID=993414 RepID=A0A4R7IWT4_9ACTN|nr:MarR family transcriptional regulator [Naumannella halotolerans]TDT29065.1 DNA-binding MarR family transcriptional regulator [Naumannella halotolerans]
MDFIGRVQQQWQRERPGVDVAPLGLIGRLHRIANHLTVELVALYAEYGLTEGEFDVLATLRREGVPYAMAAGELARNTVVTTGGMSKRLDRLESRGLITRRVSEADQRGRTVSLTDAGRELIDETFTAHMENERLLLGSLSADEVEQLTALLRHWAENEGL